MECSSEQYSRAGLRWALWSRCRQSCPQAHLEGAYMELECGCMAPQAAPRILLNDTRRSVGALFSRDGGKPPPSHRDRTFQRHPLTTASHQRLTFSRPSRGGHRTSISIHSSPQEAEVVFHEFVYGPIVGDAVRVGFRSARPEPEQHVCARASDSSPSPDQAVGLDVRQGGTVLSQARYNRKLWMGSELRSAAYPSGC